MSLVLSLLVGLSSANTIGVSDPESPPASRHRTWSNSDFRANIGADIPIPGYVVPIRYDRTGKVRHGKFYDEEGNVYSTKQVLLLLDECGDACERALDDYRRHRRISNTWSGVAVAGWLLVWPVGIAGNIGAATQIAPMNDALSRGVREFNTREEYVPRGSR